MMILRFALLTADIHTKGKGYDGKKQDISTQNNVSHVVLVCIIVWLALHSRNNGHGNAKSV